MKTPFQVRGRALTTLLSDRKLDCLLTTSVANWYYLTGFTGEAGVLLVSREGATLVTDGRFMVQGKEETTGVRVLQQKQSLFEFVGQFLKDAGYRRVGFDPAQLTVAQMQSLRKASGKRLRWIPAPGVIESLRMRKDSSELSLMRKAAVLAGEIMEIGIGLLKPGVRESEVAAEVEYQMKRLGASGPSFETIVAFGERSALPHARPTARPLGKNELVVLDLGVILGHYCSDMTRTVFVGKAPKRVRDWYGAVLEAQGAAIGAAREGVCCGDVDAAARGVLQRHKLDRFFVHSTGHGLGLEIHEDPRIARGQKKLLEPGNVITIEPGVYVEGVGGIRIEDDVAIHAGDTEVLTRIPRDLIEL